MIKKLLFLLYIIFPLATLAMYDQKKEELRKNALVSFLERKKIINLDTPKLLVSIEKKLLSSYLPLNYGENVNYFLKNGKNFKDLKTLELETNYDLEIISTHWTNGQEKAKHYCFITPKKNSSSFMQQHPYVFSGLLLGTGLFVGIVLGSAYNRAYATSPHY